MSLYLLKYFNFKLLKHKKFSYFQISSLLPIDLHSMGLHHLNLHLLNNCNNCRNATNTDPLLNLFLFESQTKNKKLTHEG